MTKSDFKLFWRLVPVLLLHVELVWGAFPVKPIVGFFDVPLSSFEAERNIYFFILAFHSLGKMPVFPHFICEIYIQLHSPVLEIPNISTLGEH